MIALVVILVSVLMIALVVLANIAGYAFRNWLIIRGWL